MLIFKNIIEYFSQSIYFGATYAFGHFGDNSFHKLLESIQPKPGKKSVRYNKSGRDKSMLAAFPLSFQAEMHQRDESFLRSSCVAKKYS